MTLKERGSVRRTALIFVAPRRDFLPYDQEFDVSVVSHDLFIFDLDHELTSSCASAELCRRHVRIGRPAMLVRAAQSRSFAQQRPTKEVAYRSLTLMLSQPLDGAALKKEMAKNKRKR